MGQITVRFEDQELKEMDVLVEEEGLATRSELVRRAMKAFRTIKRAESEGKVVVMMPPEQAKNSPIQLVV